MVSDFERPTTSFCSAHSKHRLEYFAPLHNPKPEKGKYHGRRISPTEHLASSTNYVLFSSATWRWEINLRHNNHTGRIVAVTVPLSVLFSPRLAQTASRRREMSDATTYTHTLDKRLRFQSLLVLRSDPREKKMSTARSPHRRAPSAHCSVP